MTSPYEDLKTAGVLLIGTFVAVIVIAIIITALRHCGVCHNFGFITKLIRQRLGSGSSNSKVTISPDQPTAQVKWSKLNKLRAMILPSALEISPNELF